MPTPRDRIRAAVGHGRTEGLPRGELWLGAPVLEKAGLEDTVRGHAKFAELLGQDMLCLPVSREPSGDDVFMYRYFPMSALREALDTTGFFVTAVLDGPFQRLAGKRGLMETLTAWASRREEFLEAYQKERADVSDLLSRCLDSGVHGIALCDDLAGDTATFMSPSDIENLSSSFYEGVVAQAHAAGAAALFHSCGKIAGVIPQLVSHGFDGLAAVQHRANDLPGLRSRYGSLAIMGGIDGELLEREELSPADEEGFRDLVRTLSRGGGLILSSSCGLYAARFLERIRALYGMVEQLHDLPNVRGVVGIIKGSERRFRNE